MIPVSIEGVRRNFTTSSAAMYSATLLDGHRRRIFVFSIEREEALPIVAALHNLPPFLLGEDAAKSMAV
jgi:hypothetical protein